MAQFADILITNARGLTMCPENPTASSIAIRGERIAEVGAFDTKALQGPETRIIDAKHRTVLPGLIDSHVHLFGGSSEMNCLNLTGLIGVGAMKKAVAKESSRSPDETVLYAVGADYQQLGPGVDINRHSLDDICPDRPFAMMAADHHTVWANTKALELGGILHGGETDPGAEIVMGDDGKATGLLLETSAFQPVIGHTRLGGRDFLGYTTGDDPKPSATPDERALDKKALRDGLKFCAENGITTLHNMDGNFYQMELLSELEAEGSLLCRVQIPVHLRNTHPLSKLDEALEMQRRYGSSMLYCGRVKFFMDGVVDSHTALMVEPYPDRPDTYGDAVFTAEAFNEAAIRADAMGLQISVHCCGDGAVRRTLDGYEAARNANGSRDSRHRIEHIETITDQDIPRFAELSVVASMQPLHSPLGGFFEAMPPGKIFHEHQVKNGYAWQTLRDAGAKVIFSTDWPVVPLEPMPSIAGAVFPELPDERWADQSQSLHDTLASYTSGGAFAEFAETEKGQIKPGYLADIVVMSTDLETCDRDTLASATAQVTICGGQITHQA